MERNSYIVNKLKMVYDELFIDGKFSTYNIPNLNKGLFIDPGLASAQAQSLCKFIHAYDGDENDKIISVSDVYCAKLWIICYITAKLLVKAQLIKYQDDKRLQITDEYNISEEDLTQLANESSEIITSKIELLYNEGNISNAIIDALTSACDPNSENLRLKEETTDLLLTGCLKMLLLHEFSHIEKSDSKCDIDTSKEHEKRADIDAFQWLTEDNKDDIISYFGAICLQSSGLILNKSLESISHPDTDDRLKYILERCPHDEEIDRIYADIIFIYSKIWAKLNDRTEQVNVLGKRPTLDNILSHLTKEKNEISQIMFEEGKLANIEKVKEFHKIMNRLEKQNE